MNWSRTRNARNSIKSGIGLKWSTSGAESIGKLPRIPFTSPPKCKSRVAERKTAIWMKLTRSPWTECWGSRILVRVSWWEQGRRWHHKKRSSSHHKSTISSLPTSTEQIQTSAYKSKLQGRLASHTWLQKTKSIFMIAAYLKWNPNKSDDL